MRRLALAAVLLLCGCAREPQTKLVDLFPGATEVRIFGGVIFIHESRSGIVGYKSFGPRDVREVPATDSGALTADEVALLRRSIHTGPAPKVMAMCCTPRHAFVFYGPHHRQIGYLDVCFECGCAHIYPWPQSLASFSYLNWDRKALTRIVEAHHLPPIPKKE